MLKTRLTDAGQQQTLMYWHLLYCIKTSPLQHSGMQNLNCDPVAQVDYKRIPRQPRTNPPRSAALQSLITAMLAAKPENRPAIDDVLMAARKASPTPAAAGRRQG